MDKYALVTSNATAIGWAFTLELARRGYGQVINYHGESSRASAESLARECERLGVKTVICQCDVSDVESVFWMRRQAQAALGDELEVLVCNAGIRLTGDLTSQDPSDYARVLDVGVLGALNCIHEFGGMLKYRRGGRIVFMGSTVGMAPLPQNAAYATAKAALIGLTRSLAVEFAPYGVTVNHIASGFVGTERTLNEKAGLVDEVLSRQLIKRIATYDDITRTLDYMLDSPMLTGATIAINGGEYLY